MLQLLLVLQPFAPYIILKSKAQIFLSMLKALLGFYFILFYFFIAKDIGEMTAV